MSILEDVDLASKTGFLHDRASDFRRMSGAADRHSERESRDGSTDRGRAGGRLLYRPALFQTGLQVLGIHPATEPALEHSAARDVKRKTKTRARSRGAKIRLRQQLRIQTSRQL